MCMLYVFGLSLSFHTIRTTHLTIHPTTAVHRLKPTPYIFPLLTSLHHIIPLLQTISLRALKHLPRPGAQNIPFPSIPIISTPPKKSDAPSPATPPPPSSARPPAPPWARRCRPWRGSWRPWRRCRGWRWGLPPRLSGAASPGVSAARCCRLRREIGRFLGAWLVGLGVVWRCAG